MAPTPKRKKVITLEKFGMRHDAEWLLVAPSRYEDYSRELKDLEEINPSSSAIVRGIIKNKELLDDDWHPCYYKVASRLRAEIHTKQGWRINVVAFGRPGYTWHDYDIDCEIILKGNIKRNYSGLDMFGAEIVDSRIFGKIVPIYPNIKVTKGELFAEKVRQNFHLLETAAEIIERVTEWGTDVDGVSFPAITGFDTPKDLLLALHKPSTVADGERARLAAQSTSALSVIRHSLLRSQSIDEVPGSAIPIPARLIEELISRIPFRLTLDQKKAISGITNALRSPFPLSGLLTGDVGTGKTLSFVLPMVATHLTGRKAFLMTPNLLLIDQVAKEIKRYFPEIPVCTITGKGIHGKAEGSIVIGNTALIGAIGKKTLKIFPDFLVIDEQHKFSVSQRQSIAGEHSNVLESTATPIPRTAALITHGAADIFLLKECPVKKNIETVICLDTQAKAARAEIVSAIYDRNEQAAVVYPIVESKDPAKARQSVAEALKSWSNHVHTDLIAVLHGRMSDEEKSLILDSFRNGEKRLLLTSTVIEVGVTLPELKTMLIVDADRFGVVALHQLRGRLARHGGTGRLTLFTRKATAEGMRRLELLTLYNDGFILAEKDAEMRGYGDLLGNDGESQSGKTRTLFLGVQVGPKEIGFASNAYIKAGKIQMKPFDPLPPLAPTQQEAADVRKKSGFSPRYIQRKLF